MPVPPGETDGTMSQFFMYEGAIAQFVPTGVPEETEYVSRSVSSPFSHIFVETERTLVNLSRRAVATIRVVHAPGLRWAITPVFFVFGITCCVVNSSP